MVENKDVMKTKLDYYLANSTKVHITKLNKDFINGTIYNKVNEDIYQVKNDSGHIIQLFLIEVFDIEEYKSKEECV